MMHFTYLMRILKQILYRLYILLAIFVFISEVSVFTICGASNETYNITKNTTIFVNKTDYEPLQERVQHKARVSLNEGLHYDPALFEIGSGRLVMILFGCIFIMILGIFCGIFFTKIIRQIRNLFNGLISIDYQRHIRRGINSIFTILNINQRNRLHPTSPRVADNQRVLHRRGRRSRRNRGRRRNSFEMQQAPQRERY